MNLEFLVCCVAATVALCASGCRCRRASDRSHCNLDYLRYVVSNSCRSMNSRTNDKSFFPSRRRLRDDHVHIPYFNDKSHETIPVRRFAAEASTLRLIRELRQRLPPDVELVVERKESQPQPQPPLAPVERLLRRTRRGDSNAVNVIDQEGLDRKDPDYYFKFCCRNKTLCDNFPCVI